MFYLLKFSYLYFVQSLYLVKLPHGCSETKSSMFNQVWCPYGTHLKHIDLYLILKNKELALKSKKEMKYVLLTQARFVHRAGLK